jgi:hypothetical protein
MTTPPGSDDPQRGPAPQQGQPEQPGPEQPWSSTPQAGQVPPPPGQPTSPGYGPPGQQPLWGGYGQPAAPPWAAPTATAPRDRTRSLLIAALVAVGLAIAAGVALLVYVLSSTALRPSTVERDVAALFEEQERVAIDLECDERMIVRPGADYECEGTTSDGEDVEILITIIDEQGNYTWAEDD